MCMNYRAKSGYDLHCIGVQEEIMGLRVAIAGIKTVYTSFKITVN
jgi:hypothetical protein